MARGYLGRQYTRADTLAEWGSGLAAVLGSWTTMKETPMSKATRVGSDRLIAIAEVLLEAHRVVTGNGVHAAVENFW